MYEKNCHNNTIEYPQNKIRLSDQLIINEEFSTFGAPSSSRGVFGETLFSDKLSGCYLF